MRLDPTFMESVLNLYDALLENGIYVVYIGKFNQRITKFFSEMIEDELEKECQDKITRRRVYHTIVEILQNMQRHTEELGEGSGLFMIGRKQHIYYIITSNKILKSNVQNLKQTLDRINASTKEELKQMYKKQLVEGKLSDRGGAGLGLIDIARKTESKYEYLFLPINFELDYFVLKIEIDSIKLAHRLQNTTLA